MCPSRAGGRRFLAMRSTLRRAQRMAFNRSKVSPRLRQYGRPHAAPAVRVYCRTLECAAATVTTAGSLTLGLLSCHSCSQPPKPPRSVKKTTTSNKLITSNNACLRTWNRFSWINDMSGHLWASSANTILGALKWVQVGDNSTRGEKTAKRRNTRPP